MTQGQESRELGQDSGATSSPQHQHNNTCVNTRMHTHSHTRTHARTRTHTQCVRTQVATTGSPLHCTEPSPLHSLHLTMPKPRQHWQAFTRWARSVLTPMTIARTKASKPSRIKGPRDWRVAMFLSAGFWPPIRTMRVAVVDREAVGGGGAEGGAYTLAVLLLLLACARPPSKICCDCRHATPLLPSVPSALGRKWAGTRSCCWRAAAISFFF